MTDSTTGESAAEERPLRRDAERNRQRILEGARECFATRGLDVGLDDIARHAGVGIATVYRRFPDKQVLIDALFREGLDSIVAMFEAALEEPDAWVGLTSALERALELQAADRGLMELMFGNAHSSEVIREPRERIGPLAEELVARARAQGRLRPDLVANDVPLIQVMLASIVDATRLEHPDAWRRYLQIVLDGLRRDRDVPTPLPGPPLDDEAIDRTIHAWRPPGAPRRRR